MIRTIIGVVVGYITLALLIIVLMILAYVLMGADFAFKSGSFDPSVFWIIVSFIIGIVSALLGGYVCVAIAKNKNAALWLAGLVLVLGYASAAFNITSSDSTSDKVRQSDVSMEAAMQQLKQPVWIELLIPIIGAAGVILGGRIKELGHD